MKPAAFDYARPETLDAAIALLARHGSEAKPIAGGQSLMPMLAFRLAAPRLLVDITRITDLNRVEVSPNGLSLGALVRWRDIERDPRVAQAHPLLREAVRHVAHYQIRNRGTVGGSLAHADPAAELPGIAVTCDARIVIAGARGRRKITATEFFHGPLMTALDDGELIVALELPPFPSARRWAFEEFARRRGDFALAGVALFYDVDPAGRVSEAHVGAIGVSDTPIRLGEAEAVINGTVLSEQLIHKAAAAASAGVEPADDIHASGAYRRSLLGVLTERALARASGIPIAESA
ncbi:MAG TPA: xanthine dehydrogenase family protein subunit M [Pseudolabrys sp.]|nr:xanthine dehydrogenase family protein subunit M [Pseudolabrys sp.]